MSSVTSWYTSLSMVGYILAGSKAIIQESYLIFLCRKPPIGKQVEGLKRSGCGVGDGCPCWGRPPFRGRCPPRDDMRPLQPKPFAADKGKGRLAKVSLALKRFTGSLLQPHLKERPAGCGGALSGPPRGPRGESPTSRRRPRRQRPPPPGSTCRRSCSSSRTRPGREGR